LSIKGSQEIFIYVRW